MKSHLPQETRSYSKGLLHYNKANGQTFGITFVAPVNRIPVLKPDSRKDARAKEGAERARVARHVKARGDKREGGRKGDHLNTAYITYVFLRTQRVPVIP